MCKIPVSCQLGHCTRSSTLYVQLYSVTYHFLANVRSTVNFWHKNQKIYQNSNRSLFGTRRGVRHEGSLPIRHGCPRMNLVVGNTFSIWRYFDGCARNVLLPQRRIFGEGGVKSSKYGLKGFYPLHAFYSNSASIYLHGALNTATHCPKSRCYDSRPGCSKKIKKLL
jgi:hypothetical protein